MPPASQPAPKKRKSGLIILIVVALFIILGGSIFAVASYNNSQASQHATATATAEVHAMTQATASSRATASASATALASTYPFSNKLVLHDQLSDDSHTAQYGWDQIAGQCFFINGSYNVRDSQATTYATCGAKQTNFTNFTFQVQMSIQLGGSGAAGGVIFRGNEGASQYYLFGLDAQGDYALFLENGGQSGSSRTLKQGVISNSNFIMGFNAVNTISVVARGSQIAVYVDDTTHPLFQIVDSTYSSGQIGFAVLTDSSGRAVVNYNAANVWQLP
jgi:hypothetical protein